MENKKLFKFNNEEVTYSKLFKIIEDSDYIHEGASCDYLVNAIETLDGKKAILILFQQSASSEDWKHNLSFFPFPVLAYKGHENKLWYHIGFYKEYQSVRDTIIKKVSELMKELEIEKEPTIFISGWSLGGGISQICSEDIFYHFDVKPTMIAFEPPRASASRKTRNYLYKCISEDSIIFTNGSDIVPYCATWPFGYPMKKIYYHLGKKFNIFKVIKHTAEDHAHINEVIEKELK